MQELDPSLLYSARKTTKNSSIRMCSSKKQECEESTVDGAEIPCGKINHNKNPPKCLQKLARTQTCEDSCHGNQQICKAHAN